MQILKNRFPSAGRILWWCFERLKNKFHPIMRIKFNMAFAQLRCVAKSGNLM
nr:MAG TPA_asm: hypothetical protein [Caudoviricetes sp.]